MKLKDVKKEFSKYIVIKDPYVLDVIMANIIGNLLITREPIWTMFVAPSSGGKTTYIAPCNVIPTIKFVDDMTEKTLLSAFKGKAGRETSLLRDIGPIGILAFSDFTAMLSKNPNSRSEILGQLRMVYDGEFTKRTGLGEIKWTGKMGFLGAATPEIYTTLEAGKAMGERFIYYWLTQPSDDEIAEKQKTVFISSREVTDIMKGFYREYCQSIRSYLEREGVPELIISDENRMVVRQASIFATNGKATVHTNFKTGQIDGLPNKAGIGRDYKMYETLLSALQAIECYETGDKNANTTPDHINIIKKCAYSSVNRERRKILEILAKSGSAMKTADIGFSDGLGLEKQSVELHLFPLHSVGLVSKHRSSQGFSWTISSEDMRQFVLDAKNLIQDLPLPNASVSLEELKEEEEETVTEEDKAFLNF